MAQLKNTTIDSTGFLQLPAGATGQRPGSPAAGQIRLNTDIDSVEWYDDEHDSWFPVGVISPVATGGTITDITQGGIDYRVHTFTSTGNNNFTVTRGGEVEFLIVAGGGGGGSRHGGGGGAGGLLQGTTTVTPQTYTITVGAGGAGALSGGSTDGFFGDDSRAFGFTAFGGGYGTSNSTLRPRPGGSGGGSRGNSSQRGAAGIPGQGNQGGDGRPQTVENFGLGGGGGGAGSPGHHAEELPIQGRGGDGIVSNITGTSVFYAGGGGGGGSEPPAELYNSGGLGGAGNGNTLTADNGTAGQANTGGGGGAGGHNGGVNWTGKSGGSGIVIVRYRTS